MSVSENQCSVCGVDFTKDKGLKVEDKQYCKMHAYSVIYPYEQAKAKIAERFKLIQGRDISEEEEPYFEYLYEIRPEELCKKLHIENFFTLDDNEINKT